jgi:hypothetical protein
VRIFRLKAPAQHKHSGRKPRPSHPPPQRQGKRRD